jgi:hypothetical protein
LRKSKGGAAHQAEAQKMKPAATRNPALNNP